MNIFNKINRILKKPDIIIINYIEKDKIDLLVYTETIVSDAQSALLNDTLSKYMPNIRMFVINIKPVKIIAIHKHFSAQKNNDKVMINDDNRV